MLWCHPRALWKLRHGMSTLGDWTVLGACMFAGFLHYPEDIPKGYSLLIILIMNYHLISALGKNTWEQDNNNYGGVDIFSNSLKKLANWCKFVYYSLLFNMSTLSVCGMWMFIHIWIHMCMCSYMCVQRPKVDRECFLITLCLIYWSRASLWTQSLLVCLLCLASLHQKSLSLPLSRWGDSQASLLTWISKWVLKIWAFLLKRTQRVLSSPYMVFHILCHYFYQLC